MGQPFYFKKRKVVASCFDRKILVTEVVLLQTMKLPNETVCYSFNKKYSLTLKYLHLVAKEDPRARTVDGRVVHDGSQL